MTQGPDVGSLTAGDRKTNKRKFHLQDLYFIEADRTRLTFHGLAFSCKLIQLLTIYLKSRIHRRNLLLLSQKAADRGSHFLLGDGYWFFAQDLTCHILRICLYPQMQKCLVRFTLLSQKIHQFRRSSEHNRENALGIWIQCSGMTNFLHVEDSPKFCNHIMRGISLLFSNDQNSVHYSSFSPNCFSISAVRLFTTSYMEP